MPYVGIDPGLSGAVALIDVGGQVMVWDCPTFEIVSNGSKRRESDIQGMLAILSQLPDGSQVFLEKVHGMPKQGGAAMFTFGRCYGHWEALLVALSIPHTKVTPQAWKKAMMAGCPKGKDASRIRALELFPSCSERLSRKKDDGRAEAMLIAAYGEREC